jgi:hypothetical protein
MHLSDDKTRATLALDATVDAAGLESLILQLSAVRSAMLPSVPPAPPARPEGEDAAATRARGDPVVQVAVMRDGHTRFWVRHAGLGWFGFNLPVERAQLLASQVLEMTAEHAQGDDFTRLKRRVSDLYH